MATLHPSVARSLRRNDVLTATLLAINVFVLLSCYYVLKVVREPLILLGGGAELKAYASAGQALLLLVVVPAFGWLASRVDRVRLLAIVQLGFIGCLVGFYALARLSAPIGLAFYLWLGIFNVLVVANFWSFANDLFSPTEGKKLFALIALGGSVGAIAGAVLPELLHRCVGTYALMLVAAGGLALSIALYRWIDRRARGRTVEPAAPVGREGGFALITRDRYLRSIAVLIILATMINSTGEYVVGKMAMHASFELPEAARAAFLRHFYADYYATVNVASTLLQGLVVAGVMKRLGIRGALLVMPIVVIVGWTAFCAFATIGAIRIAKLAENSIDYSLQNTLKQALFLPTSRESKYKAKAAIDTFCFRLADAFAGLGIVFVLVDVLGFGVRAFAVVNLGLAVAWLVVAARLGRLGAKVSP